VADLVELFVVLAKRSGRRGVIIGDLRKAAGDLGLLTNEEKGRTNSWLRNVGQTAVHEGQMKKTCNFRRSSIARSKGIPHRVYVHTDYYDEAIHYDAADEDRPDAMEVRTQGESK
jgi:hypothetical protein